MSNFNQLLLFELTEEERIEIIAYLEFDYSRFPSPANAIYFGNPLFEGEWEAMAWQRRSENIDEFVNKHFKIKA